jgi:hypothetical protein
MVPAVMATVIPVAVSMPIVRMAIPIVGTRVVIRAVVGGVIPPIISAVIGGIVWVAVAIPITIAAAVVRAGVVAVVRVRRIIGGRRVVGVVRRSLKVVIAAGVVRCIWRAVVADVPVVHVSADRGAENCAHRRSWRAAYRRADRAANDSTADRIG